MMIRLQYKEAISNTTEKKLYIKETDDGKTDGGK